MRGRRGRTSRRGESLSAQGSASRGERVSEGPARRGGPPRNPLRCGAGHSARRRRHGPIPAQTVGRTAAGIWRERWKVLLRRHSGPVRHRPPPPRLCRRAPRPARRWGAL